MDIDFAVFGRTASKIGATFIIFTATDKGRPHS